MEIEKLIERLQNWDGIKPDREIDCAIEGLKALQAENDRLQAELEKEEAARKKQADILYELRGQKYEQTTAIDQLQAENEKLKAQVPRWIPVEERLPGDSDGAVLLTNGKTVISGYRNQLFGLDGQHGIFVPAIKKGGGYMQVARWMPLPKLPKEGTNGKH